MITGTNQISTLYVMDVLLYGTPHILSGLCLSHV